MRGHRPCFPRSAAPPTTWPPSSSGGSGAIASLASSPPTPAADACALLAPFALAPCAHSLCTAPLPTPAQLRQGGGPVGPGRAPLRAHDGLAPVLRRARTDHEPPAPMRAPTTRRRASARRRALPSRGLGVSVRCCPQVHGRGVRGCVWPRAGAQGRGAAAAELCARAGDAHTPLLSALFV